jgi:hypothetical protein
MTRPLSSLAVALLVTIAVVSGGAGVATADTDDTDGGFIDSLLNGDAFEQAMSIVDGATARAGDWSPFDGYGDADENLQAAMSAYNESSDAFLAELNSKNLSDGQEVVRVTCTTGDESATAYLIGEYNSSTGDYDNAYATTATEREPDEYVILEDAACQNAADEIDHYADEYATTDDDPGAAYWNRLKTRYVGSVETSVIDTDIMPFGGA